MDAISNFTTMDWITTIGVISGVVAMLFTVFKPKSTPTDLPVNTINSSGSNNTSSIINGDQHNKTTIQGDQHINNGVGKEELDQLLKILKGVLENTGGFQERGLQEKLLSNLLGSINTQKKSILELEQEVALYAERLKAIDEDQDISVNIKKLIIQGKVDEAEQLVDSYAPKKAKNEIRLAAEAYETGRVKELQTKYPQAKSEFSKAAILQPQNSTYLNAYSSVLNELGEYNKSIEYLEQALQCDLNTYGEGHPNVARTRNNLGSLYEVLCDYPKALKHLDLALANGINIYGENHSTVAATRNNLGLVYEALGDYPEAIEYYYLALKSDLNSYGEDHPQVALRCSNLGSVYNALGNYPKAIEYYHLALNSDLNTYGEGHPTVAVRRNNLGSVYDALGDYPKAFDYYEQALEKGCKVYGEDHPTVATYRNNLGRVYGALGNYPKSIEHLEQAYQSMLSTFGANHPSIKSVKRNLDRVVRITKK
jgi:tetratricopeptide (TPR) repeat protein